MVQPMLAAGPSQFCPAPLSPSCNSFTDFLPLKRRLSVQTRATTTTSSRHSRLFTCGPVASMGPPAVACRTAEELQETFGCQGLRFRDVEGAAVAELKLENGCRASLFLPTAQINSYQAHMWHSGEEEMLHSGISRSRKRSDGICWESRGGIDLRFSHIGNPTESILPSPSSSARDGWRVADVRCEPSNYAQITLIGSNLTGKVAVQFRYVVTLTDESLSTALIVTNIAPLPLELTGAIVTHFAVSSVDGTFAVGATGRSYLSHLPPKRAGKDSAIGNFLSRMMGSKPNEQPISLSSAIATRAQDRPELLDQVHEIVETESCSQLRAGEDRLYPAPPKNFNIMDRGFRRSVIVQGPGFEEFSVSNPGKKSKLREWDQFVCIGPAQTLRPVRLQEYEQWRGAQILINPGHGPRTT